jgi:NifU-like protein involved in Fe-S cluster formation
MSFPIIEVYCDSCGNKIKHMITVKPIKDVLRVTKFKCKSCGIGLNPLDFTIELEKF